jgi:hypothetical protein
MTKLIVTFRHFSNALKNSNMTRNAHMFLKPTSVKLLMAVHTAVCDTGDILRIQLDKTLSILVIKTLVYELQYLLIQRCVYIPENHNVL